MALYNINGKMKLGFKFNHKEHSDEILNSSINAILNENTLMAVATTNEGGESHIHTAYFAYNKNVELFMLTEPFRQHSLNIATNSSVAIAVYNSQQSWDQPKRGLQLFGKCRLATGLKVAEGFLLYAQRFSGITKWVKNAEDIAKNVIESKIYILEISSLKIFDEPTFGDEVWIPLTVPNS